MLRTTSALQKSLFKTALKKNTKLPSVKNGKWVGASELPTSFKQDIPKLSNNNKHFILQTQFSEILVSFQLKLIGV